MKLDSNKLVLRSNDDTEAWVQAQYRYNNKITGMHIVCYITLQETTARPAPVQKT